jgi:hypothetical protein
MNESFRVWMEANRLVPIAAFIGLLIGLVIGVWNEDQIGWSLLRMAGLGIVFAWGARVITRSLLKAWMEMRLNELEEKRKQAEKAEKAKT